jgi:hypothetical protein
VSLEDIALAASEFVYDAADRFQPFPIGDNERYAPLRDNGYSVTQVFHHTPSGFMAVSLRSETQAELPVVFACAGTQFSGGDFEAFRLDVYASLGDAILQFASPAANAMRLRLGAALEIGPVLVCGQSLGGRLTQGFAYEVAKTEPDRLGNLTARTFASIGGIPLTDGVFGVTDPAVSRTIDLLDFTVEDDPLGYRVGGRHLGPRAILERTRFGGGGEDIDSHFFEALVAEGKDAIAWDLSRAKTVEPPWGWHRTVGSWIDPDSVMLNPDHWPNGVTVA